MTFFNNLKQKFIAGITLASLLFLPTFVRAEIKHHADLKTMVSHYYYYEPKALQKLHIDNIRHSGVQYGLEGNYCLGNEKFGGEIESAISKGNIKYRSEKTGKSNGDPVWKIDSRILGNLKTNKINFKAGLGYRYLENDTRGLKTTTGAYGYLRESKYFYLPLGLEADLFSNGDFQIKGKLEGDALLKGKQINTYPKRFASNDFRDTSTFNQNLGGGFRFSVPFKINTEKVNFSVEPYAESWFIGASEVVGKSKFYEPANFTIESGLKIGVGF